LLFQFGKKSALGNFAVNVNALSNGKLVKIGGGEINKPTISGFPL